MKKKSVLLGLIACLLLSGCAGREKQQKNISDLTEEGVINYETSTLGIPSNTKDFENKLVSGTYYVVHDGIYYPLYSYAINYGENDELKDWVEPGRQEYFTTENEINIPTLFEGDELVYYSTEDLLDYLEWERYYDLGYTIGLLDLQEMESGRIYLDLSDDDAFCIIPDSELYAIYDLKADYVLIDKIGGVQVDSSLVSDGLIVSTKKSKSYDLEVYTGTYFQHYTTTANTHAFKAYELYASIEYTPLQEFLYRIDIPEYFVDGYYAVNGYNMFRLVRGTSYSEDTNFNEQVLFPPVDETAWNYDPDEYIAPRRYSTYEPLNRFSTNQEGKLGYVSEEELAKENGEDKKEVVLKEAITKEFELFFPAGNTCKVQIESSTKETTGDIYIRIGTNIKLLNYDRIEGIYEAEFSGKGEKGTLVVAGLTTDYNITLVNCEQYTNQLDESTTEPADDADSTQTENNPRR